MKTRIKKEISIALLAVGIIAMLVYSNNIEFLLYLFIAAVVTLFVLGACKVSGKSDRIIQKIINDKIERENKNEN